MPLSGQHASVSFGFRVIQAGLFLYKASLSGSHERWEIGEVFADLFTAWWNSVTCAKAGTLGRSRRKTAGRSHRRAVHTVAHHSHATEILSEQVSSKLPASERRAVSAHVRFLTTVVEEIGGILSDAASRTVLTVRARSLRGLLHHA